VPKLCAIQATSKASQGSRGETLTLLELIHSDICEMNVVLTEDGQRYFMTMIDASRYCYVYLLKTRDEVLNYLKTYKAETENQLIRLVNISLMSLTYYV
jgi:RIO-like serine/threonine protein kinase